MLKGEDLRTMTPDQLDDELIKLKKEQFQPALSARDRTARQHRAGARSTPRHRADQDGRAGAAHGRCEMRSR